jgi:hypothetical protein
MPNHQVTKGTRRVVKLASPMQAGRVGPRSDHAKQQALRTPLNTQAFSDVRKKPPPPPLAPAASPHHPDPTPRVPGAPQSGVPVRRGVLAGVLALVPPLRGRCVGLLRRSRGRCRR